MPALIDVTRPSELTMRAKQSSFIFAKPLAWFCMLMLCVQMCHGADSSSTHVFINNTVPRKDDQSNIIDAHDGCLRFFNGKYYLYGTRYGDTDGWGKTNRYVVYSSPDLKVWTHEGALIKNAPPGIYYRPYVVYNKATRKYVLWFNVDGHMGVAASDEPTGPFTQIGKDVRLSHQDTGDLNVFVDTDGKAFVTYSAVGESGQSKEPIIDIFVEELTADYLASAGRSAGPIGTNGEAPALFKRGDRYYLLFDNTCSFCTAGTECASTWREVRWARTPTKEILTAWLRQFEISRRPGHFRGPGGSMQSSKHNKRMSRCCPGPEGHDVYLWIGDRWHSAIDGVKGHDFQHWEILSFDPDGMIQQLERRDYWEFDVATSPGS